MSDHTAVLQQVPLFKSLNKRQLGKLAKRVRERKYSSGDVIIEQGTKGIGLFMIVSGSAEVSLMHPDGSKQVIDHKAANDFVGELSLLDDAPRTASVIATSDVICYALLKLDLFEVLEDEPLIALEMLKEMAGRFRRLVAAL